MEERSPVANGAFSLHEQKAVPQGLVKTQGYRNPIGSLASFWPSYLPGRHCFPRLPSRTAKVSYLCKRELQLAPIIKANRAILLMNTGYFAPLIGFTMSRSDLDLVADLRIA